MAADPILGILELLEGDSQGHIRQNLRNLVMARLCFDPRIVNDSLTAPPGSEVRGFAWIIAGTGTGNWAGHGANEIAIALSNSPSTAAGWFFVAAPQGFRCWILAGTNTGHRVFNGSTWDEIATV